MESIRRPGLLTFAIVVAAVTIGVLAGLTVASNVEAGNRTAYALGGIAGFAAGYATARGIDAIAKRRETS